MGKLDGKVAFITGAARGQGRSHAIRLAGQGADIIAVDLCETFDSMNYPLATDEDLAMTVKLVEETGRRIVAVKADVRIKADLAAALEQGIDQLGRLDVVIANAGVNTKLDPTLIQSFVDGIDVDLVGVLNTVSVSLPHLGELGSIIIIGSTAGLIPGLVDNPALGPGGAAYAWSKQTLAKYVEVLALHLAPSMIRANCIHPTSVDTDLMHNPDMYKTFRPDLENPTREDAELAFPVLQAMPIPYLQPSDVSAFVEYLASDESRYMTGMNVRIDGGCMLKTPGLR